jgi:hypothetical protein
VLSSAPLSREYFYVASDQQPNRSADRGVGRKYAERRQGRLFHRPSCFGFGLDLEDKSLTARGFAGSVVSSRPITNLRGQPWVYELTFAPVHLGATDGAECALLSVQRLARRKPSRTISSFGSVRIAR